MSGLLAGRRRNSKRLRDLLEQPRAVLAPGAYDPLSARLVEEAGFPAVYMSGFGTSAGLAGVPDVGLLTMTEMADNARRIAQVVDIPLIADADNGYGNPINVIRAIRSYEAGGAAAVHIEDQVAPKKCGHMEGKQVIPAEEMYQKVRAATEARENPDFVIIARTDARAVEELEGAVERAKLYRKAGADVLFVEAVQSEEEAEFVTGALPDVPLLFNWAEGGKTPPLELARIEELGFRVVIFPVGTLLAATRGMRELLAHVREHGTPVGMLEKLPSFGEFLDFIGLPEVRKLEQRFGGATEEEGRS